MLSLMSLLLWKSKEQNLIKKNSEGNSHFPLLIPKMIVCQLAMLTSPCLEYNHKNAVNEMKGDPVFVHTSVLEPPYHSQM